MVDNGRGLPGGEGRSNRTRYNDCLATYIAGTKSAGEHIWFAPSPRENNETIRGLIAREYNVTKETFKKEKPRSAAGDRLVPKLLIRVGQRGR